MAQAPVSAHRHWQLWLPTGALLVLGILGVVAHVYFRHASLERERVETARQTVYLASQAIERILGEQRHLLHLFTQKQASTLDSVIVAPASDQAKAQLTWEARRYFPEAFAHTLADREGKVLLEAFDGLVGEVCRDNIRAFARTSEQRLHIHPFPIRPHYDVMARHGEHIFFVSFAPDRIRGILAGHELPGLRLTLVRNSTLQVEIPNPGHPGDQAPILATRAVPSTDWRLVALALPAQHRAEQLAIRKEAAGLLVALGMFSLVFHRLVARERHDRMNAEAQAREMAHLGLVDALTGLPNRRALDMDLEREWLNMERSDDPLSLLMIDLDHFKHYNDTYGHLAGDHCLRAVAQAMRTTLRRPRDHIARFGGEEFAILLPNTPCLAAKLLADALHKAVRDAFAAGNEGPGVTISVGISCAHAKQLKSARDLLDVADRALYGAKGAGRDTTVTIPAGP